MLAQDTWPGSEELKIDLSPVDASEVCLQVGGIFISVSVVHEAYEILSEAAGLMVRQPLAHYKNPLARCDYHAEAAPYRTQVYLSLVHQGHRGASAPPTTKYAFMRALNVRSEAALRDAPLVRAMPFVAEAYRAMASDYGYVTAMLTAATKIMAKQEQWKARAELRRTQQEPGT
jgi:hypothetical protein